MIPRRQRGFALLIVLWSLVPLGLLFALLSGSARSDTQLAGNLRGAAAMEACADGAINTAIFGLLQGQAALGVSTLPLCGWTVAVEIDSQSGLVNPNIASPELLRALLLRVGVSGRQAESVAAAIADWRTPGQRARAFGAKAAEYRAAGLDYGPPGAPLETLAELQDVLGVTPRLFEMLAPYLSLQSDRDPEPGLAPPPVRAALGDMGVRTREAEEPGDIFRITATIAVNGGASVTRRAVVKLGFSGDRRGWRVLSCDSAPGS